MYLDLTLLRREYEDLLTASQHFLFPLFHTQLDQGFETNVKFHFNKTLKSFHSSNWKIKYKCFLELSKFVNIGAV